MIITEVQKHCFVPEQNGAISLVFKREKPPGYPGFSFSIDLTEWDGKNIESRQVIEHLPSLHTLEQIGLVELIQESFADTNMNNIKNYNLKALNEKEYLVQIEKLFYSYFKMKIEFNGVPYIGIIEYDLLIGDKTSRYGMLVRPSGYEVDLHTWDFIETK